MKNIYRGIGIGLLIINLISLIISLFIALAALIFLPTFGERLMETISVGGLYGKILFFIFGSLWTLLNFWGVILGISLIKKNKYNKQLLFLVCTFGAIEILSFALYLPFKIKSLGGVNIFSSILYFPFWINIFEDLIVGVLVYVFLIFHDNKFSRIVKNKKR